MANVVKVAENRAKAVVSKITKYVKVCKQVYSELIQKTRERAKCEENGAL